MHTVRDLLVELHNRVGEPKVVRLFIIAAVVSSSHLLMVAAYTALWMPIALVVCSG